MPVDCDRACEVEMPEPQGNMPKHEINHADIYWRLGVLSGKVDSILQNCQRNCMEDGNIEIRLREVEKKSYAIAALAALIAAVIVPIFIEFGPPRHTEGSNYDRREPTENRK